MELFGPCRAIILFLATTHGGAMLAILAVAAAATLAHLRRQRRRQIHSKHTIDELHGATSEDVVSAFRNGVPLKLVSACTPVAALLETDGEAESDTELVYPSVALGVADAWRLVKLSVLRNNIDAELASGSCLTTLQAFPASLGDIQSRCDRHRRHELYGIAKLDALPPTTRGRITAVLAPVSKMLLCWRKISASIWVGASSGSLHYDQYDNVLVQLCGRKRVVLFALQHSHRAALKPLWHRQPNHSWHNAAFLSQEVLAAHPQLRSTPYFEVELEPGDVLCIPAGMLHAPVGDVSSVSVNAFLTDGPAPCLRSWWLRARVGLSEALRSVLGLDLAHFGGRRLEFSSGIG